MLAVGFSSLGAEIAAARLMAPFFGASTVIWANTIAVVLVALSVGYRLGGRLADRRPSRQALAGLVLLASVLLAAVPLVAHPFLSLSVRAFDDAVGGRVLLLAVRRAGPGRRAGAAARRGLAVGDPAAAARDVDRAGEVAGRLYAVSTAGLAGRDVRRRARADPAPGHAAHVPRARRRARGGGRAGAARALAGSCRPCWWPRSRCRSGSSSRPRAGACSTRPRRPTSTRASCSCRTARAGWSSTRARRSTRCGGPARC